MKPVLVSVGERESDLERLAVPLSLEEVLPGKGAWEVELGFGKGRYLLRRAQESPTTRFLGVEMASAYYRLVRRRARHRSITNLALIRGEALLVLAAVLPRGFAAAVHVYFPDPWPKARHQRRRLFDAESIDLVLGLLEPGGRLFFATDFVEYGAAVEEILDSHPDTIVHRLAGWCENDARTNYEMKYQREGRSILRLEVEWHPQEAASPLHPAGEAGILAATCPKGEP